MKSSQARKAGLLGSLVTSIMASICCIGPIVFALLGVSGAGFLLRFERYRPIFIVIALLFLGMAFIFTYRKKDAAHCEPGTLCANSKSDTINKVVLWIAAFLVALFIFFPAIISKFV